MRPNVNSDKSVTDRSADDVRSTIHYDHPSRHPKEQISGKNAQMEYETQLLQNAAHSSTNKSGTAPLNRYNTVYRHINDIMENRGISKNSKHGEHKSVDTSDLDLPKCRSSCVRSLLCVKMCRRKKEYAQRIKKPTRRFFKRMKERSKCRKPYRAAVTSESGILHREPISHRIAPRKSKRDPKHEVDEADEVVEVADKDVHEKTKEERRRERREKERTEKKERRKWEERVPHFIDTHLVTRDEDLQISKDDVSKKPSLPLTDFTKACCYLCAQNTLAIATASAKPEQFHKSIQVLDHKFHTEARSTHDKSCGTILRTIQSSVKVKTREIGTFCPSTTVVQCRETEPKLKKRKKFNMFLGLTRTKCPARRHVCEANKFTPVKCDDNAKKRVPKNEKCCRDKNI
ncbi:hypothetical protein ACFW04_005912 [Cataglyphis niger]